MKLSSIAAETRRKKILETGIQLLRKTGPDGIGIQEIADASGIPKGSFYNYFPSKDHFLLEALEIYTNAAIQWNESVLEEGGRGPSALRFLYEKKVDLEKNLLQEEFSCLINVLSQHSSSQRPELRKKLKFSLETISRGIITSLRVSESPSLLKRIQYLESSWRGAMLLSRATGDESYLENFLSNLKE
ncbi:MULTISPECIES: TetR/AcrR family transcriptional regulator [Leptospira]|nr:MULTISPECIES: TetR/AcrR family transcriptional regulator [Leptospira]EKR62104.1 transcriptional regulator, TetR family [Leptospira weilii str. 2006001853]EMJ63347.1 transcriptional regulator, TetR family [Leptospira sp. P2653]EMN44569.1 transcriptional regulator, TetR family [Leptospira weilii str. LNT 1234]EMN92201.1 transcriptional regulator, TetR family [Leptospira weilii str. UI 13098]MCL8265818.1 TetR/AcrR family transcriptional regulator [Leptospira weilii]